MSNKYLALMLATIVFLVAAAGTAAAAEDGYAGPEQCKSCHQDIYDKWAATKHATALEDGQTSSHFGEECLECHVTGIKEDGTYAFADVTCESCHGPSADHAASPMSVKPDVNLAAEACGDCHTDDHHPTYDEWNESAHGKASPDFTRREDCFSCKSTQGAIELFGDGEYEVTNDTIWKITCQACHEGHTLTTRAEGSEFCGECHTNEGATPGHEVHHPQIEVFTNGTHDRQGVECADCHMYEREYVSAEKIAKTGHTFELHPEQCTSCHDDKDAAWAEAQIERVQSETQTLLNETEELVEETNQTINNANVDAATKQEARDLYNQSLFNVEMVSADKSMGFHAPQKTTELLYEAQTSALEAQLLISENAQAKGTPGFEAVFALGGILAVAYLIGRRK